MELQKANILQIGSEGIQVGALHHYISDRLDIPTMYQEVQDGLKQLGWAQNSESQVFVSLSSSFLIYSVTVIIYVCLVSLNNKESYFV